MDLEKSLRSLRWRVSADPLEQRVLSAIRRARSENGLWRWTWRGLAASVVVSIAINAASGSTQKPSPSLRYESIASPPPGPLEAVELRERVRLALSPPITTRKMPEVLP